MVKNALIDAHVEALHPAEDTLEEVVEEVLLDILEEIAPERIRQFKAIAEQEAARVMDRHVEQVSRQTAEDWKRVQEIVNQTVFEQFKDHNHYAQHSDPGTYILSHTNTKHGRVAEFWGDMGALALVFVVIVLAVFGIIWGVTGIVEAVS